MVTVVVAGGTGNLGRTIVEALLASKKHNVKIFARKANQSLEVEIGVSIIAVDYSDVPALAKMLEKNDVHTVISTIAMHTSGSSKSMEQELIRAADASKTTKRMISSDWGLPHTEQDIGKVSSVLPKLEAQAELKKTRDLEYTVFYTGYFADHFCMPAIKSYMTPITAVLDIPNNTAAIPGSGNTPVVFTHTTDVAKFVAASLDLPKWDPETYVKGDKITLHELLKLAEDAKGVKFTVTYDSVEMLKKGQVTELPAHVAVYSHFPKEALQGLMATFGLIFADGSLDFKPKKFLNEDVPQIVPRTLKELLDEAWKEM